MSCEFFDTKCPPGRLHIVIRTRGCIDHKYQNFESLENFSFPEHKGNRLCIRFDSNVNNLEDQIHKIDLNGDSKDCYLRSVVSLRKCS